MVKESREAKKARLQLRLVEQEASKPKVHKLGFGNGSLHEHPDGTMSYRKTGEMSQTFRVRVADVTGFAVTKDGKMLERTFRVLGAGTEIANVVVNHGTSERIEAVFRAHPDFNPGGQTNSTPTPPVDVAGPAVSKADELRKLADLRAAGALTDEEFTEAKAGLLRG